MSRRCSLPEELARQALERPIDPTSCADLPVRKALYILREARLVYLAGYGEVLVSGEGEVAG